MSDGDKLRTSSPKVLSPRASAFVSILSGSLAGTTTVLLVHPLDTLRTRLQVQRFDDEGGSRGRKSAAAVVRSMLREEGLKSFYRGMATPLAAQATYKAVMFTCFAVATPVVAELTESPVIRNVLSGIFAGSMNSVVATPVELIRNRLMVATLRADAGGVPLTGPIQCAREVLRRDGWTGLWRGWSGTVMRDGPGIGAWFGAFHYTLRYLTANPDASLYGTWWHVPVSGMAAGVMFWTVALPFDGIKSIVQTRNITVYEAWRLMLFSGPGALRRLYTGYSVALLRGIPAASVTFTVQNAASEALKARILADSSM